MHNPRRCAVWMHSGRPKLTSHVCVRSSILQYRCDSVVQRLNAAAKAIMASRGIQTLDLHKAVTDICAPQPPHLYTNCSICRMEPCSFHYKPAGYAMISKPIAQAFRQLLG